MIERLSWSGNAESLVKGNYDTRVGSGLREGVLKGSDPIFCGVGDGVTEVAWKSGKSC